ncbi:hypothetical protein SCUCBS95973_009441 [Sporothrix curviconia]|uniref:Uncharacterized protein n=1 Tax=Sporothrix curviconia TaxID=1260050 RepID=A0ABP0CUZ9_9PEZI
MTHTYAHDFDPSAHRAGYIPGTDYALPYLSRHTVAHRDETAILRHVNCSLLSTPGVPPTLLALKQHAQSLSYLIAMLSPHGNDDDAVEVIVARATKAQDSTARGPSTQRRTTQQGAAADTPVASHGADTDSLLHHLVKRAGDAATDNPFDWLDLSRPYTNDMDPEHHRPLVDLVNEVESHHDVLGATYHCPLTTHTPRNGGCYTMEERDNVMDEDGSDKQRPYASHHSLLLHANMCLERLDHEYASTGGLISLLPTVTASPQNSASSTDKQEEPAELTTARNTLVGQWLAFTQQLISRMHELEIAHTNAVHFLSGEAELAPAVARGDHSGSGADGPAASPGRWILSNAGDDVWTAVHDKLDQVSATDTVLLQQHLAQGVVGERSIVPSSTMPYVDLTTRFYRATADSARGPVSVCLAGAPSIRDVSVVDASGGSAVTTTASDAATVATAATAASKQAGGIHTAANVPLLPASALEKRYSQRLQEAGRLAHDNTRLAQQLLQRTQVLSSLRREVARVQTLNEALKRTAAELQGQPGQATMNNSKSKNKSKGKGKGKDTDTAPGAGPVPVSSLLDGATRRRRRRGRGAADSTYRYLAEDDSLSDEQ